MVPKSPRSTADARNKVLNSYILSQLLAYFLLGLMTIRCNKGVSPNFFASSSQEEDVMLLHERFTMIFLRNSYSTIILLL